MPLYPKINRRFLLVMALILVILFAFTPHTLIPIVKADFTPPSTLDWLETEETSGIFSTGAVDYEITNGTQYRGCQPYIRLRSNNAEHIILGNCVADFRLIRVEDNNSLTETDYARVPVSSLSLTYGNFWASIITDYNTTYRVGVVIWNASDGSVVGRLVRTVYASAEPLISIRSDKTEFSSVEPISFSIVNHGPEITIYDGFSVYREYNGAWLFMGPNFGEGVFVDYGFSPLKNSETRTLEVSRQYTDFTHSGVYSLTIGGPILYLSAEFRVVGSGISSPSHNADRGVWAMDGALTGAVVGLIVYYYSRKRV